MDLLVLATTVACWGAVVVVWIAAAVGEIRTRPPAPIRGSTEPGRAALAVVAMAVILLVGRPLLAPFTVESPWVRILGAGVLVVSTMFAIRARLTLGSSWSVGPQAATDRGLRTDGPYAVTRHPIYTGLLGMLLGSAVLGGLGQWLVLPIAGLIFAELKIRSEERLLDATFPDAYPAYRERVPRLIPRLGMRPARRRPR